MIKIRILTFVATLTSTKKDGLMWTCEESPNIAEILNDSTADRPFTFEKIAECSAARYIVNKYKDKGAEIIYNSYDHKPPEDREGMFD